MATVPHRSPLRYPGGKTWLIPHIREWLSACPDAVLVEPFAGGAIVSLTAVMEELVASAVLVELDRDVAAFWRAATRHSDQLIAHVEEFVPDRRVIDELGAGSPLDVVDHGFRTLVLNRTRRGGILAPGASLTKNGENGKGLLSRWYPETITRRIREIARYAGRLAFFEGDGQKLMEVLASNRCFRFFVDPPYTAAGGKRAGSRLYAHNSVNHARIFQILADSGCDFLLTYDYSQEIVDLIRMHDFRCVFVEMKNGHHARVPELVVTRDDLFS